MRSLLVFLLLALPVAAQTSDSLDFLAGLPDFQDLRQMLPTHLNRMAFALLDERERAVARFTGPADVAGRRTLLRDRMQRALGGPWPARTPLNPRTVAVLDRDGYRVEKVIFESHPRFYVTANLYIPKSGRPPYPAVLYPLGHEAGSKAHSAWQQMLVTLARRGYLALAWDPIGQGERVQLFDPDLGESKVVRSTTEHSITSIQCLLSGDTLARYTVYDGLRALDYMLSRPEADASRVACTGNSGGGTHTAYLSALDDRIHVAAPSCYLTSWRRLLLSIGPQDGEQCLPPLLADGLDHADFVHAFAPKPYLILSAVRDFFSISGARETYAEALRAYELSGASGKISMVEADDGHGYSKPRREAAYRWFARWLKNTEDNEAEQPIEPESEQALQVTSTGQVATSLGGETVHSLNLRRVAELKAARRPVTAAAVRDVLRFNPPRDPLKIAAYGVIARPGYRIEKLTYESVPGILIPSLLYVPAGASRAPAVLYVHGRGKSAARDAAESLVKAGSVVLAIDYRGAGETSTSSDAAGSDFPRWFGDYHSAMKALLIGKPLAGMRAEDIVRGLDLLAGRAEVDPARISAHGRDAGAVPLLHAAVLDSRITGLTLDGMLASFESIAAARIHRGVFENVIPGVLRHYDLPDLVAALSPRPVAIRSYSDALGRPVAR